jgi:hypothetical protein
MTKYISPRNYLKQFGKHCDNCGIIQKEYRYIYYQDETRIHCDTCHQLYEKDNFDEYKKRNFVGRLNLLRCDKCHSFDTQNNISKLKKPTLTQKRHCRQCILDLFYEEKLEVI